MQEILNQEKCIGELKGEITMQVRLTQEEKIKMVDKARSVIIMCLEDKFLMKVAEEKHVTSMWAKLESLYMTKSLTHRLCLKQ